jgi:hypothetical protein
MKNKILRLKPLCCASQVLALAGSYHGDTLGAMEAQCSSPYTGPLQQPWYKGRGCFLDPPKEEYVHGRWRLQEWNSLGPGPGYSTREELFSTSRGDIEQLTLVYKNYIEGVMDSFSGGGGAKGRIGGLILEPGGFIEGHVACWTNEILVQGVVIVKVNSRGVTQLLNSYQDLSCQLDVSETTPCITSWHVQACFCSFAFASPQQKTELPLHTGRQIIVAFMQV